MSNLETAPDEFDCVAAPSERIEIMSPRDVPLGGPRAMQVRRTLPQRQRSLIGAWCFADHYGPEDVRYGPGMDVPPHPHTGLQTVSWLFEGEVEHRDAAGVHAFIRPGELNLMTAGAGICHSEVSTPATSVLHGVQLWVALPDHARNGPRGFDHYVPESVPSGDGSLLVFLGELAGDRSPVSTFTPLLGAQLDLPPGGAMTLAIDPAFEHGLLVDTGTVAIAGQAVEPGELAYRGCGADTLSLRNPGDVPARAVLLGGTPFTEDLLMWWNFVGRSHEEIVEYREQWQAGSNQFGAVSGYTGSVQRLPAPGLPSTHLRPRPAPVRKDI